MMTSRKRARSRVGWPDNLYPNRDGYKYRHPVTRKETWMGTDKAKAFAAAKKLNAILTPADDLVARVAGGGKTVTDAILVFRSDDIPGRSWAPKTAEVYESIIRRIEKGLGERELESLSVKDCAEFIRGVTNSARARQQFRLVLGWILACAVQEGWIDSNPALATRKFTHERQRARLTAEDLDGRAGVGAQRYGPVAADPPAARGCCVAPVRGYARWRAVGRADEDGRVYWRAPANRGGRRAGRGACARSRQRGVALRHSPATREGASAAVTREGAGSSHPGPARAAFPCIR